MPNHCVLRTAVEHRVPGLTSFPPSQTQAFANMTTARVCTPALLTLLVAVAACQTRHMQHVDTIADRSFTSLSEVDLVAFRYIVGSAEADRRGVASFITRRLTNCTSELAGLERYFQFREANPRPEPFVLQQLKQYEARKDLRLFLYVRETDSGREMGWLLADRQSHIVTNWTLVESVTNQ